MRYFIAMADPITTLKTIESSWSWIGLKPDAIIKTNAFGNLIVRAKDGAFWRICPEDLTCEMIACDHNQFQALWSSMEFQHDWQMQVLVQLAASELGPVSVDRCYCLKIPSVLGGPYEKHNLGTISRLELISFSGFVAQQIENVPDGGKITLKVSK